MLKLRNDSAQPRRLSVTGYVEWVLGDLRAKTAMHVTTEIDAKTGALFARNAYNSEFPGRIAFFDVDDANRTVTGDRAEFLGRNGSLQKPGGDVAHAPVGQGRCRARSVRGDPGRASSSRRGRNARSSSAWAWAAAAMMLERT